ncbi:MAG: thiamine biosynthesis protein ThiS [unclassified Hahellaceae]|nr:thiamine biosynthesis protein ThiS [Hahellaceae bacterium]|tara:strand:+ start:10861 stop:11070 length:210 start_codon:yes stop_codon:yes gene_type:complete
MKPLEISVNGESCSMPADASVADLLAELKLTGRRIAVELNEEIVPKSSYAQTRLTTGDQLEIVHAIGGG